MGWRLRDLTGDSMRTARPSPSVPCPTSEAGRASESLVRGRARAQGLGLGFDHGGSGPSRTGPIQDRRAVKPRSRMILIAGFLPARFVGEAARPRRFCASRKVQRGAISGRHGKRAIPGRGPRAPRTSRLMRRAHPPFGDGRLSTAHVRPLRCPCAVSVSCTISTIWSEHFKWGPLQAPCFFVQLVQGKHWRTRLRRD